MKHRDRMGWEPDLRILSINPAYPVVFEPFVQDRLAALAARGYHIRVLTERRAGPLRVVAALCAGLVRDPWFVIRLVARLRRMHGRERFFWQELVRLLPVAGDEADVVHFEWLNDATRHLELLDILPGVKIASSQGSDLRVAPHVSTWIRRRLPLTLRALDGLHCVSSDLGAIAVSYGADVEKVAVIPNGVDTSYFSTEAYARRREPSGEFRVMSVGRLHWVKGYSYALHAVRILVDRGHDVRYTIVGGEDGDGFAIELAIRDLGLENHVRLAGQAPRHRVRALLANADAFLLPSVSEGMCIALLEAMAMSVPVVATDVGGTREVVHDSEHGFLVPSRDPSAIADAAERLIKDPDYGRQMGERGAAHVRERFDAQRSVDELVAFYERLVPSWRLVHRPAPA